MYQILLIVTPLITTPYVSRVLGAQGIGTYSYYESIASYFVLFANMGISLYGQREISYFQENKEKRSEIFWNTKALNILTSIISLILYYFFGILQHQGMLFFILSINIIAVIFDVSWFFQGIEEFGKTVFRNIIFKFINVIFIFMFIKSAQDLLLYIFGMCFFALLGNFSLWLYLPKYIYLPKLKTLKPLKDIKTVILLFLPTIAIQIYTVLDKTMIGLITQDAFQNGYYEQALKISRIVLTIVTSLGTVMIPRIGFHYNRGEFDIVKDYMYRGYNFVWFLGIPLCFGLIGISQNFVPWFFGENFEGVIPLLMILSFLILSIGINNVTGMQYLIPTGREKIFTITVIIGAITNFILNLILIIQFKAVGAAIASVAAETVIAIIQIMIVRNELKPLTIIKLSFNYIFAGLIMLLVLYFENKMFISSIKNTLIMIMSGAFIYFSMLFLIKDKFFLTHVKLILKKINKFGIKNE